MNIRESRNIFLSVFIGCTIFVVSLTLSIGVLNAQADSADVEARKVQLEKELASIEVEIDLQQKLLEGKQKESASFERDISILDGEIEKAQLSIRARNLSISKLSGEIDGKEETIGGLNNKLDKEKESLAQLIRRTNEIDDLSMAEVVLGNQNLSDFFEDLDSFDSIKAALSYSFVDIENTKEDTETEKQILEGKQNEELELRSIQVLQKRKIEVKEEEKQKILKASKGVEAVYQKIIVLKQKSAGEIRAELFTLRGSAPIPFEKALEYANFSSSKTGVRAAVILGVIAQESNLGENVGQCLLTNEPKKGDGKGVNTGRIFSGTMKSTRDVDPFMDVTSRLGINPYSQVVSCPPSYGYGGAMGPAQFIPSTWILYEDRIAKMSGQSPPNPWDPKTAFIATGILMMDNGADRGTWAAERLAALRYFAGWRNAEKRAYAFYGDEVMGLAAKYQGLINVLASSQ